MKEGRRKTEKVFLLLFIKEGRKEGRKERRKERRQRGSRKKGRKTFSPPYFKGRREGTKQRGKIVAKALDGQRHPCPA